MARQLHPAGSLTYSTSENTDNRSLLVVAGALSQTLNLDSISLVVQGLAGDRMITAAKAAPSERSVPADVGHSPPPTLRQVPIVALGSSPRSRLEGQGSSLGHQPPPDARRRTHP